MSFILFLKGQNEDRRAWYRIQKPSLPRALRCADWNHHVTVLVPARPPFDPGWRALHALQMPKLKGREEAHTHAQSNTRQLPAPLIDSISMPPKPLHTSRTNGVNGLLFGCNYTWGVKECRNGCCFACEDATLQMEEQQAGNQAVRQPGTQPASHDPSEPARPTLHIPIPQQGLTFFQPLIGS